MSAAELIEMFGDQAETELRDVLRDHERSARRWRKRLKELKQLQAQ